MNWSLESIEMSYISLYQQHLSVYISSFEPVNGQTTGFWMAHVVKFYYAKTLEIMILCFSDLSLFKNLIPLFRTYFVTIDFVYDHQSNFVLSTQLLPKFKAKQCYLTTKSSIFLVVFDIEYLEYYNTVDYMCNDLYLLCHLPQSRRLD